MNKRAVLQKLLKYMGFSVLIGAALIIIAGSVVLIKVSKSLPNVAKLVEDYNPITPTVIYDQNGKAIDTIYSQKRSLVNISDVPSYVPNAFVAVEDHNFYHHHGISLTRIAQSAVINVVAHRYAQGGSTITQQLARNAFLNMRKTITRKLQEIIITIELERKYTKPEILSKYINVIYFGSGVYGIDSAARQYFGIPAKNLNIAQAAFLAGIPNNPALFSPYRKLKNAEKRQKLILGQMLKYHFITEDEYRAAMAYKIKIAKISKTKEIAPAFTDIVKKILKTQLNYSDSMLYSQGLKIYTTLNIGMQNSAEKAFKDSSSLKKNEKLNGALVSINSQNGYVEALIGGKNYKSGDFNRAISAIRQPGSSFKPFVYLAALEQGIQMNQIFEDTKFDLTDKHTGVVYSPNDADGETNQNQTLLYGISHSINIVAVKLLQKIGYGALDSVEDQIGFSEKTPHYPSVALGSITMTPFQLAQYYIPLSNGGYKISPIFITKVEDRYGNVIYKANNEKKEVVESKYITLLTHMLKTVVKSGSGRVANIPGLDMAGKTGTSNGMRDAWFVGYTGNLVTAVFQGYDNHQSMERWMYGGAVSGPIWKNYMQQAIDSGIYKPVKFVNVANDLQTHAVVPRWIDGDTGLLTDDSTASSKKQYALFLNGKFPVEASSKYDKGLDPFFDKAPY